jgi:chemosensory pili system protein ChpC
MNTATERSSDVDSETLNCVVIPVSGHRLLLPNVCVAEIVPGRRIRELKDSPTWCIGFVSWRGQNVPVVHYDGFNGGSAKPSTARCLVIMNRSHNALGPPFYALAAEGLPRMVQVLEEDLTRDDTSLSDGSALAVKIGAEAAVIPDLGFVEQRVRDLIDLT